MVKYNRNYRIVIETANQGSVTITLPFTIEFTVIRNNYGSANISTIRLYNLAPDTRNQVYFNRYNTETLRKVVLYAGYGNNLALLLNGNISECFSVREGVNFITQIEAFDYGYAFANAIQSFNFPENTEQKTVIATMASSLGQYGVSLGAIGDYSSMSTRAQSYVGSTTDLLRELSGGGFFIDNGIAHCLQDGEGIVYGGLLPPLINSGTGLLGTPLREETYVNFDLLFDPYLILGQVIVLQSTTLPNFNTTYKINALTHKAMISSAVCGDAVTSVGTAPGTYTEVPFFVF